MTTNHHNEQSEVRLEPCPWCEAVPMKTDLAPSQRYRLDHKPTCYLYRRQVDMRGNSRYVFISLSQVESWNTRSRASVAAPPQYYFADKLIYEDDLPKDITKVMYDQWYARSRIVDGVRMGPSIEVATPVTAPVSTEKQPLCAVHKRLEDVDALECEIGNNCVACSLNERRELLQLIAPFAAAGNTEDSVTVLRRVAEFYATHVGDGRVVVSYPAATSTTPVDGEQEKI